MNYDDNNILKRIVRKELPCHLVYENAEVMAFMDIMPQSPGHTLVVPKHADTDITTSAEAAAVAAIKLVRLIAQAALTAFAADGIVVSQFNGKPAGQTIFHLHFHVIPVYDNSPLRAHARTQADSQALAEQAARLATALARVQSESVNNAVSQRALT
jgi:histidine triad (HIT) family protein